jgi:hypothetical protein
VSSLTRRRPASDHTVTNRSDFRLRPMACKQRLATTTRRRHVIVPLEYGSPGRAGKEFRQVLVAPSESAPLPRSVPHRLHTQSPARIAGDGANGSRSLRPAGGASPIRPCAVRDRREGPTHRQQIFVRTHGFSTPTALTSYAADRGVWLARGVAVLPGRHRPSNTASPNRRCGLDAIGTQAPVKTRAGRGGEPWIGQV